MNRNRLDAMLYVVPGVDFDPSSNEAPHAIVLVDEAERVVFGPETRRDATIGRVDGFRFVEQSGVRDVREALAHLPTVANTRVLDDERAYTLGFAVGAFHKVLGTYPDWTGPVFVNSLENFGRA